VAHDSILEMIRTSGGSAAPAAPLRRIRGPELRYVLTLTLADHGRVMTMRDLIDGLHRSGLEAPDRESKAVYSALRSEAARGRVIRAGRGRYRTGRIPRSTRWWMRQRVLEMAADAAARHLDPGAWSGP
jgi:hypothetical protein